MESRIGEFLVKIGAMNTDQVAHVLKLQEGGDARIFGEIALELGFLDDDAIKRYVDHVAASRGGTVRPGSTIEEL